MPIDLPGYLCDPTGARAERSLDAVPASYPRGVLRGERPKRVLVPFARSKGTPSGKRPHQAGKPEPWMVRRTTPQSASQTAPLTQGSLDTREALAGSEQEHCRISCVAGYRGAQKGKRRDLPQDDRTPHHPWDTIEKTQGLGRSGRKPYVIFNFLFFLVGEYGILHKLKWVFLPKH